jgi:FtsP/CotA-like multicopper oxidase with cupredoxin domain
MMEHPIHLHGFLFRVENGQGNRQPLKHTINVKPGEKVSFVYTADTPGRWAFHCHLLYHMEMGMFRTVVVAWRGCRSPLYCLPSALSGLHRLLKPR